jgi:hypothetical protein
MKRSLLFVALAIALTGVLFAGACKHSGQAVTSRGQILSITIEGVRSLAEGESGIIDINLTNPGPTNIGALEFTVEIPHELTVINEDRPRGVDVITGGTPEARIYHYRSSRLAPLSSTTVRYTVRAGFGSLDRTGDVKVTAWQENLPGDRLIETRAIELKR